ncbi:oligosaccharide flippase family protein [Agaribacterium haliotis]|uniref:oligosaccharide flippase family protein n=1 Tax=Agaribacterium haliotis TaxID=2013869 RepID=UPI000BB56FD6|nr:oligosaccharide flippase family protein [Agaribacterium haliotis]
MLARVSKSAALLFLQQFFNLVLPLVAMKLVVDRYGVDQFGKLVLCQALMQYFMVAVDFGFNITATNYVAKNRDRAQLQKKVVTIYSIKLLFLVLSSIICLGYVLFLPELTYMLLLCFVAVIGQSLYPYWYFLGLERLIGVTALSVIVRVFSLLVLVFFLDSDDSILIFVFFLSFPYLVVGVVGLGLLATQLSGFTRQVHFRDVLFELKEGWPIFISNFCSVVYTNSSVVIVSGLAGSSAAGIYGVADRLIKAVLGGVGVVSQAFYPVTSQVSSNSKIDAFIRYMRMPLVIALVFGGAVISGVFLVGERVMNLVVGQDALDIYSVLLILSPIPMMVGLSSVLGVHMLTNLGMTRAFGFSVLVSTISFGLSVVVLAPLLGVNGVAWSYLLAELSVVVVMAIMLEHRFRALSRVFGFKRGVK